jgi:hypothetical protein
MKTKRIDFYEWKHLTKGFDPGFTEWLNEEVRDLLLEGPVGPAPRSAIWVTFSGRHVLSLMTDAYEGWFPANKEWTKKIDRRMEKIAQLLDSPNTLVGF